MSRDYLSFRAKTKALISCAVTAQLICVFDFALLIIPFSHDEAQLLLVVCDNMAYTYVRKLNRCIRRSTDKVTFPDARASCQADGGDLLMVKDENTRLYLKEIMMSVTGISAYYDIINWTEYSSENL